MRTAIIVSWILTGYPVCDGEESTTTLPTAHYVRQQGDPDWLAYAAQFHGHLGPWATAGARLGMAGRNAAGARGYFDVRVTCEGPFQRPPKSCFLDGVQVATGATMGKGNLRWVSGDKVVVRVENTHTGREVEVRPTENLLRLLNSFKPRPKVESTGHDDEEHDHDRQTQTLESIARRIAALADREILMMTISTDRDDGR
jgi:formylmethanofuran dehydrogenase subunit E